MPSCRVVLPAAGHRGSCSCFWAAAQPDRRARPAVAAADLGGVAALRAAAVLQGRRDEPGDRALRLLLSLVRVAQGVSSSRIAHRHAARVPARPVADASSSRSTRSSRSCGRSRRSRGCRSGSIVFQSSEPAAVFTIALCAMWPTVINTAVGVRSINPGLPERRPGAAAVALDDAAQDHHPGDAALRLHRLPAVARSSPGSSSSPPRC